MTNNHVVPHIVPARTYNLIRIHGRKWSAFTAENRRYCLSKAMWL